jgi:hypothetical protein
MLYIDDYENLPSRCCHEFPVCLCSGRLSGFSRIQSVATRRLLVITKLNQRDALPGGSTVQTEQRAIRRNRQIQDKPCPQTILAAAAMYIAQGLREGLV